MTKNPLTSRIRRQLPKLAKLELPPPVETLTLGQLLDQDTLGNICHINNPERRHYSTRRLGTSTCRHSPKPIPCVDAQDPSLLGHGLIELSSALREILNDYYPRVGIKPAITEKAKITPRNLARLVAPFKQLVPKVTDNTRVGSMTFRQYFGDLLSGNSFSDIPLFPVETYQKLNKFYPYPSRWADVGGLYSDDLRLPLAAVWDYYRIKGLGSEGLLDTPLTSIADFLQPLADDFIDHYPTGAWVESICDDCEDFWEEREQFSITFPYIHGDSEEAECVVAFLEGPESIAAYTNHVWKELGPKALKDLGLSQEDASLVEEKGILALIQVYAKTDEGRTVPMNKLANFWDTYFKEWRQKYPHTESWDIELVAYDDQPPRLKSGEDILMIKEYAEIFDQVIHGHVPWFSSYFREEGLTEFLGELCRVYRLGDAAETDSETTHETSEDFAHERAA